MFISHFGCFFILQIPGKIRQGIQCGDRRDHDRKPQYEIRRQDIQNGRRILRPCHEQIIGSRAKHPVGNIGDHRQNHQGHIGSQDRFYVGPHTVNEDHVENRHIAEGMLCPKLIIAEPGRACIGDDRRRDQGKYRTAKQPEIGNIKQELRLSYYHKAAKYHCPATYRDGQMIYGIRPQGRYSYQPPIIGHFRHDQGKRQHVTPYILPLAPADRLPEHPDQHNDADHYQDRQKMGQGKITELHLCAGTEKVRQKIFHGFLSISLRFP